MPGEYVLWFDPRSTACKRALELLRERGIEPVLRRFLEEPPTPEELVLLLARLSVPAKAIARADADEYHVLRLSDRAPEEDILRGIAQHPSILERPIFVAGGRAIIARPPERVLELLPPAASRRARP